MTKRLAPVLLFGLLASLPALSLTKSPQAKLLRPVSAVNVAGLPVSLADCSIEDRSVSSEIELLVNNGSGESASSLSFRVLIYDQSGKLSATEDGIINEKFPAGELRRYRTSIEQLVSEPETVFIVPTKLKTSSGVWLAEGIEANFKARGALQIQSQVSYEPDLVLTESDKDQLLSAALKDLLKNPNTHLGNRTPLLLLRESCAFASQAIREQIAESANLEELQAIANREERVVFLVCKTFEVEGSRVIVHLVLDDRRRQYSPIVIPFRFNYSFVCVKRNNSWSVEKRDDYS